MILNNIEIETTNEYLVAERKKMKQSKKLLQPLYRPSTQRCPA